MVQDKLNREGYCKRDGEGKASSSDVSLYVMNELKKEERQLQTPKQKKKKRKKKKRKKRKESEMEQEQEKPELMMVREKKEGKRRPESGLMIMRAKAMECWQRPRFGFSSFSLSTAKDCRLLIAVASAIRLTTHRK